MIYWAESRTTGWKLVLEVPYQMIVEPARMLAEESAIIGGVGLILLLGVVFGVARKVSGPIRELQSVASNFEKGSYGENNEFLCRIGDRPDELGDFASSFSTMAREIALREARLSEWSSHLEATVEQRTAALARAMHEVEKTNQVMAAELAQAAAYSRAVLPEKLTGEVTTDWIFETSTQLGGDSFGYHWIDEDHLAIYLLDVCGHGVGAALLSVSVVNLLRTTSLTEADFLNPASVLSCLNATFPMEKHNDMYFTAWYGVYARSSRTLCYACAGHPPALLITPDGATTQLRARGLIVGAFPSATYETESIVAPAGSRLYVFSDGVYEIDRPGKPMMSYQELQLLLNHTKPGHLDLLVAEIRRQQGSDSFVDDFSIIEFHFQSKHP
jgi:serine phosphatase RsbU (regulator of sigma subunit)